MVEHGNALSRNPNVCASCSSLADGMEDSALPSMGAAARVASAQEMPVLDGVPAHDPAGQ
jgi:hypothetical protein